jgi:hypothetical protein
MAGKVGDGSNATTVKPVQVTGITTATQISGGFTTCALLADKTAKCWGSQGDGQITGSRTDGDALLPENVPGISNANEIQTDGFTTCAMLSNGTVRCWGRNGDALTSSYLTTIPGITTAKHLGDGNSATCAILADGTVKCWSGADGTPSSIPGLTGIVQLSGHCALRNDGSVLCWSNEGQIIGSTDPATPMLVPNLGKATQIAASSSHVCAILSDKSLSCWGKDGFFGPIDYGTIPLQISGVSQVAKVAVGESNTCVIQVDNTVKCWGSNLFGQLGNGTTDNAATPVNVIGLPSGG